MSEISPAKIVKYNTRDGKGNDNTKAKKYMRSVYLSVLALRDVEPALAGR